MDDSVMMRGVCRFLQADHYADLCFLIIEGTYEIFICVREEWLVLGRGEMTVDLERHARAMESSVEDNSWLDARIVTGFPEFVFLRPLQKSQVHALIARFFELHAGVQEMLSAKARRDESGRIAIQFEHTSAGAVDPDERRFYEGLRTALLAPIETWFSMTWWDAALWPREVRSDMREVQEMARPEHAFASAEGQFYISAALQAFSSAIGLTTDGMRAVGARSFERLAATFGALEQINRELASWIAYAERPDDRLNRRPGAAGPILAAEAAELRAEIIGRITDLEVRRDALEEQLETLV